MIASVTASIISDYFYAGSIYDRLMSWNGINLRGKQAGAGALIDLKAEDVMQPPPECLAGATSIKSLLSKFSLSPQRAFPVLEGKKLIGMVTQTDLGHALQIPELSDRTVVADVMTKNPVSVSPYDSLEEILFLFTRYKFAWLPVCDRNELQGIITQSGVVEALFPEIESDKQKLDHPQNTDAATDSQTKDES